MLSSTNLSSQTSNSNDYYKKGQRRKIIGEEDYQDHLSKIIQRDYFPDVPRLERHVAVLQCREAGDIVGAIQVRKAARLIESHEEVLRDVEKEQEQQIDDDGMRSIPRPLHRETLTGFHARVTSEDNAAFEQTQAQEVEWRRRLTQQQSNLLLLTNGLKDDSKRLTNVKLHPALPYSPLPLASDQFNATPHRKSISEASVEPINALFFVPEARQKLDAICDHQPLALMPSSSISSAGDNKQSKSVIKNQQLMMPPPARRETTGTIILRPCLVEYTPKTNSEKRIVPEATRFPNATSGLVRRPQQEWDVSTDHSTATFTYTDDNESTDLDSSVATCLTEEKRRARKRKRKQSELETFVQMTPVILPGQTLQRGTVDASPIVTWGRVNGPTTLITTADDNRNGDAPHTLPETAGYSMPDDNHREKAAIRAAAQVSMLAKQARGGNSSSITSRTSTPARQQQPQHQLAHRGGQRPLSARSSSSFGTALRASYSGTSTPLTSRPKRSSTTGTASLLGRSSETPVGRRATRDTAHLSTPRFQSRQGLS